MTRTRVLGCLAAALAYLAILDPLALAGTSAASSLPPDCRPGALGHFGYTPNATDGTISVVDLDNNRVVDVFGNFRFPWNALISQDGRKLYVDDSPLREVLDNRVVVVDVCSRTVVGTIPALGFEFGTTSPDEKTIWISNISTVGTVQVDANSGTVGKRFATLPLTQGALSADNKTLWCISLPGLVTTFDMKTTLPNGIPIVVGAAPAQFAMAPDGTYLATANLEGTLTLIDTEARKVVSMINMGMTAYPSFAVFSPDSKQLWAGSYSGEVAVVDVASRKVVKTLNPGGWIGGVTFSNDGGTAYVTTTPDGSIVPQFGIGYLVPMLLDVWKPGGVIQVINAHTYEAITSIRTGNVPIVMAIPGTV